MSKIIFFGAGKRLKRIIEEKQKLISCNEILFAIDNNNSLWGKERYGIGIYNPDIIINLEFEYIVISCAGAQEMYEQLLGMGIPQYKIMSFKQFMLLDRHGEHREYGTEYVLKNDSTNLVIVSTCLAYNGGAIAVMNAAKTLMGADYNVLIAAPNIDDLFIEEIEKNDLSVSIMPGLEAPGRFEREWITQFDFVFVNSFIMLPCLIEFQKIMPLIWWLHESSFFYPDVFQENPQYLNSKLDASVKVFSVSGFAKRCFEKYYPNRVNGILPLATMDMDYYEALPIHGKCKFVFVGEIVRYKGLHTILDAYEGLSEKNIENSELWIIGRNYNDIYGEDIKKRISGVKHIKYLGVLSQRTIEEIYEQIDVLVCASPEEMLPTVCIEAMKHGRLCIVSSGAGITEYLTDGNDSFIFNPNDITELSDRMSWVINHREEASIMGNNARQVFLEHLTSDVFISKVNDVIKELSDLKGQNDISCSSSS